MKRNLFGALAGSLLLSFAAPAFAGDLKDAETGKSFVGEQTIWGKAWRAVGVGAREKLGFNVYAIALYVEVERGKPAIEPNIAGGGEALYKSILNCSCGRGVEIKMARAVSGPDIKAAFIDGLKLNLDTTAADVKDDVTKLGDFLNYDVAANGQYKFYVSAGGNLSATGPGGSVTIKNAKVAKALLSNWLGAKNVQADIKPALIANISELTK
jgi:hypothetical protein